MPTLTRPEGTRPEDLHLSRRALGLAAFGGYAVYALSADAEPIHTDEAGLVAETVQLPAADRPIPAYLARPDAPGRFPVVVVVSEVFGVHEYIRDVCRRLAKLGYVALAPDFFVRSGQDPSTISDFGEIRKIVSTASDAQVMGDLRAGLTFLSRAPFADRRRMAITGFCWGGAVVWLACSRFREFRAGVAWYGRLARPKPGDFLGEPERRWPIELVSDLRAPVLGLYAGKDQGIPLPDVEAMRQALAAHRKRGSEIIVYPEAQHGFHADYRAQYDAQAAQDGWARMLLHFARNGVAPRPV
ncbi:dienelactone hydrolase family protein [Phenylobacterium terrae]|uniref:Dienelactone hydrolase family protein n=1 Tax=Phenylobacterium terrae TaxID=2665495 RepID=A0ABW4MZ98_9CAUL